MSVLAASIRHCERSEAIQGGVRNLWIAASPAAPRNDGTGRLGVFASSRESISSTRRREGGGFSVREFGVMLNAFQHRHAELVSASRELSADGYVWPLWTPDQVRGDEIAINLEGSVG